MIRRGALMLCVLFAVACERAKAPAPGTGTTTAASPSSTGGTAVAASAQPWDDALGAVVATPSLDGGLPVMFARDTASTADVDVELFSHEDRTTKATLRPGSAIRPCAWRRTASVTTKDGRAAGNEWALALSPGIATPFGIEAVAELTARDSAAIVARVSRLVSAIPEDSASAAFRGLPIVVRDAWRFRLADSTLVAVAIAMRSVNVESNPRAEAITVIAEPDSSTGAGQWRTSFSERVAGPEDRIEGMDLLAAFEMKGKRPAVALVRESDAGLQVEVVERTAPGTWKVRWTSSALPCAQTQAGR